METTICPALLGLRLENTALLVKLLYVEMVCETPFTVKILELPLVLRLAYNSIVYFFKADKPFSVKVRVAL